MKRFLTDNLDVINMSLGIMLVIITLILILISYVINAEKYKKIVILYEEEFGRLPITASLARTASLIGTPGIYFAKIDFIMSSLIFPITGFLIMI